MELAIGCCRNSAFGIRDDGRTRPSSRELASVRRVDQPSPGCRRRAVLPINQYSLVRLIIYGIGANERGIDLNLITVFSEASAPVDKFPEAGHVCVSRLFAVPHSVLEKTLEKLQQIRLARRDTCVGINSSLGDQKTDRVAPTRRDHRVTRGVAQLQNSLRPPRIVVTAKVCG